MSSLFSILSNSKMYPTRKNLDITKPCYSEHILPVSWSFIILRFPYIADNLTEFLWLVPEAGKKHCVLMISLVGKMGLSGWEVSLSQGLITNINFTSTDLLHLCKERLREENFLVL